MNSPSNNNDTNQEPKPVTTKEVRVSQQRNWMRALGHSPAIQELIGDLPEEEEKEE